MKRVAIYVRVSTADQNPDLQLNELIHYCDVRSYQYTIYSDVISGAKRSRPELDRLMADAEQKHFDTVLVWKFDRFARSLSHLIQSLEFFEQQDISFISIRDNVDLSSSSGRLMFHIIGAMAEFERSLIRERVKAGLSAARNRGVRIGRPKVFVKLSEVKALREKGHSWDYISDILHRPSTTIRRAAAKEGIV